MSSTSGDKSLPLQSGPGRQSPTPAQRVLCPAPAPSNLSARAHFMLLVTQAAAGTSVYTGLWGYPTAPAACLRKKMGLPGKTGDGLFLVHILPHWCTQQTAAWRSGILHRSLKHFQTSLWPASCRGATDTQPKVPLPLSGSWYMRQTLPRLQSPLHV